jgi:hypothetical protein
VIVVRVLPQYGRVARRRIVDRHRDDRAASKSTPRSASCMMFGAPSLHLRGPRVRMMRMLPVAVISLVRTLASKPVPDPRASASRCSRLGRVKEPSGDPALRRAMLRDAALVRVRRERGGESCMTAIE